MILKKNCPGVRVGVGGLPNNTGRWKVPTGYKHLNGKRHVVTIKHVKHKYEIIHWDSNYGIKLELSSVTLKGQTHGHSDFEFRLVSRRRAALVCYH